MCCGEGQAHLSKSSPAAGLEVVVPPGRRGLRDREPSKARPPERASLWKQKLLEMRNRAGRRSFSKGKANLVPLPNIERDWAGLPSSCKNKSTRRTAGSTSPAPTAVVSEPSPRQLTHSIETEHAHPSQRCTAICNGKRYPEKQPGRAPAFETEGGKAMVWPYQILAGGRRPTRHIVAQGTFHAQKKLSKRRLR